jgi:hypothetical protein
MSHKSYYVGNISQFTRQARYSKLQNGLVQFRLVENAVENFAAFNSCTISPL